MSNKILHTIEPVYNSYSKILILGTMPSPKSRGYGFYYGHLQNRMWLVLSQVLGEKLPITNEEKKSLLLDNNIAMWDVLKQCDIQGADDSSIKNPVANDLTMITNSADIKAVFTTGLKAFQLYNRYCIDNTNIEAIRLPSTSPANCGCTVDTLVAEYSRILNYL